MSDETAPKTIPPVVEAKETVIETTDETTTKSSPPTEVVETSGKKSKKPIRQVCKQEKKNKWKKNKVWLMRRIGCWSYCCRHYYKQSINAF